MCDRLPDFKIKRIFRYVDDFLIFLDCSADCFDSLATNALSFVREGLSPLVVTHELPTDGSIRFLDIRLLFHDEHIHWKYDPRANKPLLPYQSAHSKLVKRGIAKTCLLSALRKSCPERMSESFNEQIGRLRTAGYPTHVLVSVSEGILKFNSSKKTPACQGLADTRKVAVIPYIHGLSHRLKKIGQRANVKVVFSAPTKLQCLCRLTRPASSEKQGCKTKHKNRFVKCADEVVYRLPLTCGKNYVGQSGRCVNERLKEHHYNVKEKRGGFLDAHCRHCTNSGTSASNNVQTTCMPIFQECSIVNTSRGQLTREIIEAELIDRLEDKCISKPSIALSCKELAYLRKDS